MSHGFRLFSPLDADIDVNSGSGEALFPTNGVPLAAFTIRRRTSDDQSRSPRSILPQPSERSEVNGDVYAQQRLSRVKASTSPVALTDARPSVAQVTVLGGGVRIENRDCRRSSVQPGHPGVEPTARPKQGERTGAIVPAPVVGSGSNTNSATSRRDGQFDYALGQSVIRARGSLPAVGVTSRQAHPPPVTAGRASMSKDTPPGAWPGLAGKTDTGFVDWEGYARSTSFSSPGVGRRSTAEDSTSIRVSYTSRAELSYDKHLSNYQLQIRRHSSSPQSSVTKRKASRQVSYGGSDETMRTKMYLRSVSTDTLTGLPKSDTQSPVSDDNVGGWGRLLPTAAYPWAQQRPVAGADSVPASPPFARAASGDELTDEDCSANATAPSLFPLSRVDASRRATAVDANDVSVFQTTRGASASLSDTDDEDGDDDEGRLAFLAASVFRPSRQPQQAQRTSDGSTGAAAAGDADKASHLAHESSQAPESPVVHHGEQSDADNFMAASVFRVARASSETGDEDKDDEDDVASLAAAEAEQLRRTGGGLPQQWKALAHMVDKRRKESGKGGHLNASVLYQARDNAAEKQSEESSVAVLSGHLSLLSAANAEDGAFENITTSFFNDFGIPSEGDQSVVAESPCEDVLDIFSDEEDRAGTHPLPLRQVPVPQIDPRVRNMPPLMPDRVGPVANNRAPPSPALPHSPQAMGTGRTTPQPWAGMAYPGMFMLPQAKQPQSQDGGEPAPWSSPHQEAVRRTPQSAPRPPEWRRGCLSPCDLSAPSPRTGFRSTHPPPQPQPSLEGPKIYRTGPNVDLGAVIGWRLADARWVDSPTTSALTAFSECAKVEKRGNKHRRR